jgi:hypothetical protein
MNKRTVTVLGVVLGLAMAGVLVGLGIPSAPSLPYVQWVGKQTHRQESGFVIIRHDAAWQELWQAHTGNQGGGRYAAPLIDFAHCQVVASFVGPTVNRDGQLARSVQERDDALVVRFESSSFQTAGDDARGGAVDTNPFGIWVIPASHKQVIVEEGHLSKTGPTRWEAVHRFDAPPGR